MTGGSEYHSFKNQEDFKGSPVAPTRLKKTQDGRWGGQISRKAMAYLSHDQKQIVRSQISLARSRLLGQPLKILYIREFLSLMVRTQWISSSWILRMTSISTPLANRVIFLSKWMSQSEFVRRNLMLMRMHYAYPHWQKDDHRSWYSIHVTWKKCQRQKLGESKNTNI